jgi:hypothetical protein
VRSGTSWVQRGGDIDGEAAGDLSGVSVSISSDGRTVAIGANENGDSAVSAGHVRVFVWEDPAWTQLGGDIDGEAANDYSGQSVSLSDDGLIVAVGAYGSDMNGAASGHVRVFVLVGSVWTQRGADIDGEAANDFSGYSVALSGDGHSVALDAQGHDSGGNNAGRVRVFMWSDASQGWTQRGSAIDGVAAGDNAGLSVSLSVDGNTLALGAPSNDASGSNAGHVRIFVWSDSSSDWIQRGQDINGEGAGDNSGMSVSLSADGHTVAIGAPKNGGSARFAGHARVLVWADPVWTQLGNDIDGEERFDYSGQSVSLSADGKTVAIGAYGNNGNGSDSGHVRVFTEGELAQGCSE